MTCVKPFTIPDRWDRAADTARGIRKTRSICSTRRAPPLANPDVYIGSRGQGELHRLQRRARQGHAQVTLKADNDSKIAPSFYYPWDMPGENRAPTTTAGTSANCNTSVMGFGELFAPKPGNMVGSDQAGHGRPDRPRSERLLGHRPTRSSARCTQPARRRDSALRSRPLRRRASRTAATPAQVR